MNIRIFHPSADQYAGEIVATSLVRSFTSAQVVRETDSPEVSPPDCGVWINPQESESRVLKNLLRSGGKALVLGRIGPRVAEVLGLHWLGPIKLDPDWAVCSLDSRRPYDASPAEVCYRNSHPLARLSPLRSRPLCRFDFDEEWNNLGFGRITLDDAPWALQSAVEIGDAQALARIVTPDDDRLIYAALSESPSGAVLWINRSVGPVDSLEWRIVEAFLGDYRADDLPCFPYVSEIPAPYRAAVCARLDCDQAVCTAGPLFDLYRSHGWPLSLALQTGQQPNQHDIRFLRQRIAEGQAVVSHSVNHYLDWGGTRETTQAEALGSRAWFERHLSEALPMRYAVSPFHRNPSYAVAGLADSGYDGFVGGIIANDPEYLLGRAGRVPFAPRPIVSLSTQCMLHGECYRRYGNSMNVYCQSFDAHRAADSIFGYLDHPFAPGNQYGWPDEATRLAAHRQLIDHVRQTPDLWLPNLCELFDFLRYRDRSLVEVDTSGTLSVRTTSGDGAAPLTILWKGQRFAN